MKLFFLLLLILFSGAIKAQECNYFPADCPESGDIEAARDSMACIGNLVIAQEITMQNELRKQLTSMMEEIAGQKNWEMYEYTEDAGGGIGVNGTATPYPLRPPHQYMMSFDFIVNKDSLAAWQNWYDNDLQNASNGVVNSYKQTGNEMSQDDNRKKYLDSANYYGEQKAKYMTDHAADYQKALLSNDVKAQKKYEDEMKKYDDRINACINKTNGENEKKLAGSASQFKDLETYKHKNTIAFRNASLIRVSLDINNYIAVADDENKKITKQLSIPTAELGLLLHNNSPDEHEIFGQYLRSPDIAMLLFGKWILKQDQYHSYHSAYSADKKNTDKITMKKIPCDKIQTIILHVEGSLKYINQFLQSLDAARLNHLIVQE